MTLHPSTSPPQPPPQPPPDGPIRRRRGDETEKIEDQSRWVRFCGLRFNPIVTISALIIIVAFVAYCCADDDAKVHFAVAKTWITNTFTWFYIGSQDVWAIFVIWLYFSKYSQMKLGKDDDEPEFNDFTWFFMFFSCGIGVGLFFYGVGEPIFHYAFSNRYQADFTMPDNTLAQIAMNVTLYHWGIHAWIVYCVMGIILGLTAFRKDLPMTIKSCFWPLIGDKIFGWVGDFIDTLSIFTTLFGVCTSLGLGALQINRGINFFDPTGVPIGLAAQLIIIWCITVVATCSTISGIGLGIRRLSEICFVFGLFLLLLVLFLDNTCYLMNLFCQSVGFYFQWILQLGWHTDAFEQIGVSSGGRDRGRDYDDGKMDGPDNWMDGWTMFYWGWWIAWCPFVGMFIARISKGRTIREFINGTMTAPCVFAFLWIVVFGGAGIRLERQAASQGLCCDHGLNATKMSAALEGKPDAPMGPKWTDHFDGAVCLLDKKGVSRCGRCTQTAWDRIRGEGVYNDSLAKFVESVAGEKWKVDEKKVKADERIYKRLSCSGVEGMWFGLMFSYEGVGRFLAVISIIGIILYFVTSSDSGSLVIDSLSANGDPEPPRVQRAVWALIEGATATALLVAGGSDGLTALQTVSIVMGLPYTIVVCFVCVSIYRLLQHEFGIIDLFNDRRFQVQLLDPVDTWNPRLTAEMFLNIFAAPATIGLAAGKMSGCPRRRFLVVPLAIFLLLFIVLHICVLAVPGIWALAWVFYIAFALVVATVRLQARRLSGIPGNVVEDFLASFFFYPGVALQVEAEACLMASKVKPNEVAMNGGEKNPGFDPDGDVKV